ncbi:hypothetical protein [Streptomyces antibioticus]|uniref:hypothetical protein n=1 Tax=Streptomyces antibioticus TaxID=1890 RepID=UPI0036C76ADB
MPDTWIGLTAAERRRNWWWTGVLTLMCVGMAIGVTLPSPSSTRWWWGGGVGVAWSASLFYMVNRGYGRTLLTASGMQFHTFVSRRSIPWSDITGIEKREHHARSATWWDLRAVRVHGRPLTIPGAFTSRLWDAEFDNKLAVIQEHWTHGRSG